MKNSLHKIIFIICLFTFIHTDVIAQLEGLWMVNKVRVGEQVMTPVAKWVQLQPDGTQFSGNGWLQHTSGTWNYNKQTAELYFTSEPGPADEFGAFKVKYDTQHMTWERMEEGEKVVVELEKTTALPQSPADQIQGLWDLEKVVNKNTDITNQYDPDNKLYVFMRWDRIYVKRTATGERTTGFWHVHAHRPELELIPSDSKQVNEKWQISFSDSTMIWVGLNENNKDIELTYQKIKAFPK